MTPRHAHREGLSCGQCEAEIERGAEDDARWFLRALLTVAGGLLLGLVLLIGIGLYVVAGGFE